MADPTLDERLDTIEEVRKLAAAEAKATARAENAKQRRNAIIGYVILLVAVVGVFFVSQKDATDARDAIVTSGKVVSVEGCNSDFETIEKVRGVFTRAIVSAKRQERAGVTDEVQRDAAIAYYEQQLAEFTLPDCRKTEKIITDDPRKAKYPPPYPRYEGDGR